MQKSIWLLLLLLMMSEERVGRKARKIHRRRSTSRRAGRQVTYDPYPTSCQVRYPGLYDPENPNTTWNFGSCPGSSAQKCRSHNFDYERCCSSDPRCTRCPNEILFPEGKFPPHPHNCEEDVIKKPKHLTETERMVTYPGFVNSDEEFPEGTCPWLPYQCHYSQTFEPKLCCDPGDDNGKLVRKGCECPNKKLFPAHVTYPGYKDPAFQFPPGFCPGVDERCKESRTWVRGCCTIEPVEIGGETCQCPNFDLFPSGPVDSARGDLDKQLQATTSLSGVQLVTYDNYEQPDKDFARGSCPGVPEKCRFSTSFDEDACCDRKISNAADDEECGCPNFGLFKVHGPYPGYREPSLAFPPGYCPGVSAWCKRIQNSGFSTDACCGGDCPCSCTSPQNCPNPNLFPGGEILFGSYIKDPGCI